MLKLFNDVMESIMQYCPVDLLLPLDLSDVSV
uniref:Uncharacterized protein n=1 Tax=Anguilla anguilla TaxID=7936 RepID=A0A0E9TD14_ANGAN